MPATAALVVIVAAGLAMLLRGRTPPSAPPPVEDTLAAAPEVPDSTEVTFEPPPVDSAPAPVVEEPVRTEPVPARPCTLALKVSPWAEVMLDGRPAGVTPLAGGIVVAPGEHRLTLLNPYYPAFERTVSLSGPACELEFDLEREFARVEIVAEPWAVVEVDGALVDTTPIGRPLPMLPGEHVLTLTHPEFGSRVERIIIDSAGPYRFRFDMAQEERDLQ